MQGQLLSPIKAIQRKLLDAINNAGAHSKLLIGFASVLLLAAGFMLATLRDVSDNSLLRGSACPAAMDNIGGVDASGRLCHEPIDVVYTWVNGSDMEWFKLMRRYRRAWDLEHGLTPPPPSLEHGPMGEGGIGRGIVEGWNSTLWATLWNCTGQKDVAPYNCSLPGSEPAYACLPSSPPSPSCSPLNMTALYWQALGGQGESLGPDDIASLNRYRDNDELRYSIRSLFKYSPWIRHIILVTNGQVPAWLDTSHPRVRVVTHEDIYVNKSHLPVFSSPSIEVHLHRIPGLSSRFIYFNDDVMLGSDTWPDDYGAPQHGWGAPGPGSAHGQRVFLAWEVPKCNTGCIDSWIGDGYCDAACNVSRCGWDAGDCVNGTKSRGGGSTTTTSYSKGGKYDHYQQSSGTGSSSGGSSGSSGSSGSTPSPPPPPCAYGCHDGWIGDRVCDEACKVAACGWDAGDCGIDSLLETAVSTVGVSPVHAPVGVGVEAILQQAWGVWQATQGNTTAMHGGNTTVALQTALLAALHSQLRVYSTSYAPVLAPLGGGTTLLSPPASCEQALPTQWVPIGPQDALVLVNVSGLGATVGLTIGGMVHDLHAAQGCVTGGGEALAGLQALLRCVQGSRENGQELPSVQYDLVASEVSKSSIVRTGSVIPSAGLVSLVLLPRSTEEARQGGKQCGAVSNSTAANETDAAAPPEVDGVEVDLPCGYVALDPLHVYLRLRLMPTPPQPGSSSSTNGTGGGLQGNSTQDGESGQHGTLSYAEEVEVHVALHPVQCPAPASSGADGRGAGGLDGMLNATAGTEGVGNGTVLPRRLATSAEYLPPAQPQSQAGQPARLRLLMPDASMHSRSRGGGNSGDAGMPVAQLSRHAAEADLRRVLIGQEGAFARVLHEAWRSLVEDASQSWAEEEDAADSPTPLARRLADTYADSLITTNKLVTARFGKRTRKVPAHMPHLIDARVMAEVQAAWPGEFEATSARRFRDGEDIQYAFMYMWFILEGGARRGLDVAQYFGRELDTDGDGVLSPNELRTLAAVVHKRSPTAAEVDSLRECMAPSVRNSTTRAVDGPGGVTHEVFTLVHVPHVTWDRLSTCPAVVEGLAKHARFGPTGVEVPNSEEVAFEMVSDDYNKTRAQLDSIRARRPKWVCVNDDMKSAPQEVQALLRDFYTAFFPLPSPVELPPSHLNPVLYIGPLRAYRAREAVHRLAAQLMLALVGLAWVGHCWRNRRVGGKGAPQDMEATPAPCARKPGPGPSSSSFGRLLAVMTGRKAVNQRLLLGGAQGGTGRPEGSPALHPRSLQGELLVDDSEGGATGGTRGGAGAMPAAPAPPSVSATPLARSRARAGSRGGR